MGRGVEVQKEGHRGVLVAGRTHKRAGSDFAQVQIPEL